MKGLLVVALLAAVACAPTPPKSAGSWRRVNDQAEPFDQARAACKSYAMKKAETPINQGLAAKVAAGAFAECMRDRGWSLVDAE